jgi:hypothetical protein
MYVPFSVFCVLFAYKCVLYCCHRGFPHLLRAHPSSCRMGTVYISWGLKRLVHGADHLFPSGAYVKESVQPYHYFLTRLSRPVKVTFTFTLANVTSDLRGMRHNYLVDCAFSYALWSRNLSLVSMFLVIFCGVIWTILTGRSLGAFAFSREAPVSYFWYMLELPDAQSIKRAQNLQTTVFPPSSYLDNTLFLNLQYRTRYCSWKVIQYLIWIALSHADG